MGRRSRKGGQQSKVSAIMPNVRAAREVYTRQKEEEAKDKANATGIEVKSYAQAKSENDQIAAAAALREQQARESAERQKTAQQSVTSQPASSSSNRRATVAEGIRTGISALFGAGRKSKTLRSKFDRCVKSVKKTVKARKGSSKESAAIGICTTSVLHPRGRTIKRYRKGRLTTQKKFRGGGPWCS